MNPNFFGSYKTYNITTNGTTIIPGRCILIALVINTKGASSNVATIYDSTEVIGENSENKKGTLDTVNTTGRVDYGIPMLNGIYIVTAAGTAPDITVIYADYV